MDSQLDSDEGNEVRSPFQGTETGAQSVTEREFVVIYSARSLAWYRHGEAHILRGFPHGSGVTVDITLSTQYQDREDASPVPRRLVAEVRCKARTIEQATTIAFSSISALSTMIALTTNAAIDRPVLFIAYDATPGIDRRRFLQYSQEGDSGSAKSGRFINQELLSEILHSPERSSHITRVSRAAQQYEYALANWTDATHV